jgi:hypothetical protein
LEAAGTPRRDRVTVRLARRLLVIAAMSIAGPRFPSACADAMESIEFYHLNSPDGWGLDTLFEFGYSTRPLVGPGLALFVALFLIVRAKRLEEVLSEGSLR